MNRQVIWTLEAEMTFEQIIQYLEKESSEKEIRKFVRIANKTLKRIAAFPYLFEASASNPSVRKGFVTKQCSLFYQIEEESIMLLYFWDNRRKPPLP